MALRRLGLLRLRLHRRRWIEELPVLLGLLPTPESSGLILELSAVEGHHDLLELLLLVLVPVLAAVPLPPGAAAWLPCHGEYLVHRGQVLEGDPGVLDHRREPCLEEPERDSRLGCPFLFR